MKRRMRLAERVELYVPSNAESRELISVSIEATPEEDVTVYSEIEVWRICEERQLVVAIESDVGTTFYTLAQYVHEDIARLCGAWKQYLLAEKFSLTASAKKRSALDRQETEGEISAAILRISKPYIVEMRVCAGESVASNVRTVSRTNLRLVTHD